jgi:hypothetical protein
MPSDAGSACRAARRVKVIAPTTTIVFDTKPYDRDSLQKATRNGEIDWKFMEFRLGPETAVAGQGAQAVCIFVNDHAARGAAGGRSRVEMKNQNGVQVYLASASKGVDVSSSSRQEKERAVLPAAHRFP